MSKFGDKQKAIEELGSLTKALTEYAESVKDQPFDDGFAKPSEKRVKRFDGLPKGLKAATTTCEKGQPCRRI